MIAIKFENVSKKYKLYSKGGLYLRDRFTHALGRLNPFNGRSPSHGVVSDAQGADSAANRPLPSVHSSQPLALGTPHALEKDFWALKNVSFEIKQGESVGFIGRNGAGKSTILKLLAGVTKASSGTAEVNGKVAALIEVGAGFHPELTGRENVFLNGSILGLKKTEIEKAFDSIVSFAELEDFIDTPVKHYSSGMYVRLGFAIAAHTNPDIFLIDEVLSVGDEAFQKKCLDTLAKHRAAGKTMILVSHALETVEEVCDRCIYLNHGEVGFDGSPVQGIKHYRHEVQKRELDPLKLSPSQGVEITDIIFLNESGEENSTTCTGDDLIIEIRYSARERINNPSIGVMIHDSNNLALTGFNTRTTSHRIDAIEGEGSIFCRLRDLPFRDGSYRIRASIADYACEKIYHSYYATERITVKCVAPFTYGILRYRAEFAQGPRCPWVSNNDHDKDRACAKD